MVKQRYWLSFDLGLRGNYEELFEWLDNLGAKECADNLATFTSNKTREQIKRELVQFLGADRNVRVYIIDRNHGAIFLLGKRKAAPWVGYSTEAAKVEEEK